jgi:hypothetical protein
MNRHGDWEETKDRNHREEAKAFLATVGFGGNKFQYIFQRFDARDPRDRFGTWRKKYRLVVYEDGREEPTLLWIHREELSHS